MATLYQYGYFSSDISRIELSPIDLKKAISLNTKAMEMGVPRAINNLGLIFYNRNKRS